MVKDDDDEITESFEIDWTQTINLIKPSTGLYEKGAEKHAYYVLWLSTKVDNSKKGISVKRLPWLITDDGRSVQWTDKELMLMGLSPEHGLNGYDLSWNIEDVRAFINESDKKAVDIKEVYSAVKEYYGRYIDFQDTRFYDLAAVWIIGTYFMPAFNTYPFLYLGGVMQSGKTKNLKIISIFAFNPLASISISASALFRTCQGTRGTLLIDETGYLRNQQRAEELRTLLYGRYKQGQSVQRVEKIGDAFVSRNYDVFGATALANIDGLEAVLEQRCITILMQRTLKTDIANAEPDERDPLIQDLKNKLYRLYLQDFKKVIDILKDVDKTALNLSGRSLELWRPILSLARYVDDSGTLFNSLLSLAEDLEKERKIENFTETAEGTLVFALSNIVKADDWYSTKKIKTEMETIQDETCDWLNSRWISRAMKRLGITEKRRLSNGIQYHATPDRVKDIRSRLGFNAPDEPAQAVLKSEDPPGGFKEDPRMQAQAEAEAPENLKLNIGHLCEACFKKHSDLIWSNKTDKEGVCDECHEKCLIVDTQKG